MKLSNFCFYPWQSNLYQSRPPAKHNYKTEQSVQDNFFPGTKRMVNEGLQPWEAGLLMAPAFHWVPFFAAVQGRWSQAELKSQWLVLSGDQVLAHVKLESQRKKRKRRE